MELTTLVDRVSPSAKRESFFTSPLFERAVAAPFARYGHEASESLVATIAWQQLLLTPILDSVLPGLGATARTVSSEFMLPKAFEVLIVAHESLQCDLVILDPNLTRTRTAVVELPPRVIDSVAELGFRRWQSHVREHWTSGLPGELRSWEQQWRDQLQYRVEPNWVREAARIQPFRIILAPRPRHVRTAIPNPAWRVNSASTAGALAQNSHGTIGVTAALHAVKGQTALIKRWRARVVSRDRISDSCFLALRSVPTDLEPDNGPLIGMPTPHSAAYFHRCASGRRKTYIDAWSPDILFPLPESQVKVFTPPVTARGDSGTALLDKDRYLLGFSFYRSATDERVEYSAWIWAESVYRAHRLQSL